MVTDDDALQEVQALRGRLDKIVEPGPKLSWKDTWDILENDIEEFAERTFDKGSKDYSIIRDALHPRSYSVSGVPWQDFLNNKHKNVSSALKVLEHRLNQGQALVKERDAETVERFIEPHTPYSAYVALRQLIEGASEYLWIIDPYVDRSLFPLLGNVNSTVKIRILTRQQNVPGDFAEEQRRFVQEKGVQLKVCVGLDDFHDRFLVVDGKVFLSGASFKDLGKKGSVVTEIKDIPAQVLSFLEQKWTSASPLQ